MKRLRLILAGLLVALIMASPSIALASDVSGALYEGTIIISNNSSAASDVATTMTLSTADLISQGYANATLSNIAMRNSSGADIPFGPSINSTYPWCIWVSSIGANTEESATLYTGGPSMNSTKSYFPDIYGANVTDSASLEHGNNFIERLTDVYLSGSGNIITKSGAYTLSKSTTNVTYTVNQATAYPTIATNSTGTQAAASANWSITLPGGISSGDLLLITMGMNANKAVTLSGWTQLYNVWNTTIKNGMWYKVADGTEGATTNAILDGLAQGGYIVYRITGYSGVPETATATGNSINPNPPLLTPSAGSNLYLWLAVESHANTDTPAALPGGYVGTLTGGEGGVMVGVTAVYKKAIAASEDPGTFTTVDIRDWVAGTISIAPANVSVTTTGIADGETDITIHSDGANLWMVTGSTVSANTTTVNIPDTSTIITVGGNVTPYIGAYSVTVAGVLKGSWAWQYATTFTDLSGNGNTMTPSFRTATSNANVTANMTAFAPISTAIGPAYSVASPSSFYSSNITTSGNFTTGNVTGSGFPGSAVVDAGAAAGSIPNIWLWGILGAFTMVMAGLAVSVMVRFGGAGNGELFIRMGIAIAVLGVMVALGKYDMWMIVFYLFIAGAFAMASRQYDIGASVGELNFIGFLSQSWVGLVGINRILEGSFMTSSEAAQWNTLMFTQQYTIGDTFTLPIMNFSFWTEGLPNMVKWNYTFFGGNAQMIQYLLYSLTAILAFIIFGLIIGTLSRTFTR